MSSQHPRILAELLRRRAVAVAVAVALGGGGPVVTPTGEVTQNRDLLHGSLDVFMEAEAAGAWLAPLTLPVMVPVFFAGRFTSWQLIADDAYAELVVEVWRDTLANLPPTSADLISGTAPPTLAGARSASSA